MSRHAHKGQILPIVNQMIPISKNTTFHASYDYNLCGYNQSGRVSPLGPISAMQFNNLNSDTVMLPFGKGWNPYTSRIEIELWVKIDKAVTGRMVIGVGNGTNERLYIGIGYAGTWEFGVKNIGWRNGQIAATTDWTRVSLVLDGGVAILYVNGEVSNTENYTSYSLSTNFGIGASPDNGYMFEGRIGEVKVWKDRELFAYYKMNEKSGNIIYDESGAGNEGIRQNPINSGEGRIAANVMTTSGKFKGSARIEQDAQNFIKLNRWRSDGSDISIKETFAQKPINAEVALYQATGTTGYGNIYINDASGINQTIGSRTWTFSCYVKRADGKPVNSVGATYMYGRKMSDKTSLGDQRPAPTVIQEIGEGWYRVCCTMQYDENAMIELVGMSSLDKSTDWLFCGPMLEMNPIATSYLFPNTKRQEGFLSYPLSIMNSEEGTLSFWGKIPYSLPFKSNKNNTLCMSTEGTYTASNSLCFQSYNSDYNSRIIGVHWAGENGKPNHINYDYTPEGPYKNGEWNHYTITWKRSSGYQVYINGIKVGVGNENLPLKPFGGKTLDIMGLEIDELRIENTQISEEEVQAWAASGLHYNYLDYSPMAD